LHCVIKMGLKKFADRIHYSLLTWAGPIECFLLIFWQKKTNRESILREQL
jgi:hypothetical protein